jgi:hypothetical protein
VILRRGSAALALLLVAGCGHGATTGPRSVALDFERALAGHDGNEACTALAPETRSSLESSASEPCLKAVLTQQLRPTTAVRQAEQYGSEARVVLDQDVLFLSQFSIGWRVVAAGCRDRGKDLPYDCQLSGK